MLAAPPSVWGSVFGVLAILSGLTSLITAGYHYEKRELSRRQFEVGRLLAQQGRHGEAISAYRAALALARHNAEYRLALARELIATARPAEAERHLLDLAGRDPVNGAVNLMLARLTLGRGRTEEATEYYRRAIYGIWPEGESANRVEARFELVTLLLNRGATRQAQAQLLQLGDEIADDPQLKKRAARMFLEAGDAEEARDLYRQVLRKQSLDAEAYAGLGACEAALGDYGSARNSLRTALRWNAHDAASRELLELVEDVLALDPSARRIPMAERLRRSRTLIERARGELSDCLNRYRQPVPSFATAALDAAGQFLSRPSGGPEAVEAGIAVAEQVNAAHMALCGAMEGDRALMLVLNKMAK